MPEERFNERFTGGGGSLAQRAMEQAQDANSRMTYHERLCTERYSNIDNKMNDVLNSIKGLWKIVLITGGALIVGMSTILTHQIFH